MSGRHRSFAIADESRGHALGSSSLRLMLRWLDDRWSHAFELEGAGIVRAIEPKPDESARFATPVFQQATLSTDGDADFLALLVGQKGRHHSSATFHIDQPGDGTVAVSVDLALCATRLDAAESFSLASIYLVETTSSELVEASDSRIVWSLRGRAGRLTLDATSDDLATTTLALTEGGRRATLVQAIARFDPSSLTQRSRYRWTWQPARGHS